MEITADHLLNAALLLPDKDRALLLAAELIGSLDPTWDDDHEAAWSGEIARRMIRGNTGESQASEFTTARKSD